MEITRASTEGQLRQRKPATENAASAQAAAASVRIPSPSRLDAQSKQAEVSQVSQIHQPSGGATFSSLMRSPDHIEYPDLSEPGAADSPSVFPGGMQPSAPFFSDSLQPSAPSFADTHQPGAYHQLEREPLMAQSQPSRQHKPIVQTQNGPRPLSPDALARLEHLRAKARMAETREAATVAAQKRGELPPDEVLPIHEVKYKVQLGDDLTDLAVRFGSSVASIQAANRRVVWQHSIDHIAGEMITIPATRMGPEVTREKNPTLSAEQAQANKEFALCRTFQAESRSRASEEEARFYLEDNAWNLGAALNQYREDVEWEKAQKAGGKSQPMHNMQPASASKPKSAFARFFS